MYLFWLIFILAKALLLTFTIPGCSQKKSKTSPNGTVEKSGHPSSSSQTSTEPSNKAMKSSNKESGSQRAKGTNPPPPEKPIPPTAKEPHKSGKGDSKDPDSTLKGAKTAEEDVIEAADRARTDKATGKLMAELAQQRSGSKMKSKEPKLYTADGTTGDDQNIEEKQTQTDGKNSVKADETGKKTVPIKAYDGDLEIAPKFLRWEKKVCTQTLTIYNKKGAAKHVVKLKCSDNVNFKVTPVHMVIDAGAHIDVSVTPREPCVKANKLVVEEIDLEPTDVRPKGSAEIAEVFKKDRSKVRCAVVPLLGSDDSGKGAE
ncbi:unnamed protein product, partial [Mesorhabditis spiculigera]